MSGFLERLELRTNRAYWGDGLLDLFCGLAVAAIGVAWVTEQFVFGAVAPALFIPLWKPCRRCFTEPRLGMVELGDGRQARNRAFTRLALLAGVLCFLVVAGASFASGREVELSVVAVKAMPGAIVGLAGVATAAALQLTRFFVYGGVTVAGAAVVAVSPALNPGWAFVAGGLAALLGGLMVARGFARRHPRAPEGDEV